MMYQQKEKNYRQAIMEQARDADQAKGKDADKAGPANGIPVQGAAEQTFKFKAWGRKSGSPGSKGASPRRAWQRNFLSQGRRCPIGSGIRPCQTCIPCRRLQHTLG